MVFVKATPPLFLRKCRVGNIQEKGVFRNRFNIINIVLMLFLLASLAMAQQPASSSYWTGDGGKGMSLAILVPKDFGLTEDLSYVPALVQGLLVTNIQKYSAISVLDRVSLDEVLEKTTLDPIHPDPDNDLILQLGKVAHVGYVMTGRIFKTSTGYTLQIMVTDTTPNARTIASYSGVHTVAQFDNQTAIQLVSKELLTQMGVRLSERAIRELSTANSPQAINAQTMLARGVTAERQGTEVIALSYLYQATALDTSLLEASARVNTLFANISSGNALSDAVNDIQWRRAWRERLIECEQLISRALAPADLPYTLFYSTDIKNVAIDYEKETISFSFETNLRGRWIWFDSVQKAVQAVYDGLNATGRKSQWGFANWPHQYLSGTDPFSG